MIEEKGGGLCPYYHLLQRQTRTNATRSAYDYSKYEPAALIRMNGAVGILNRKLILNIQTENAAIARRIYVLLKKYYQWKVNSWFAVR